MLWLINYSVSPWKRRYCNFRNFIFRWKPVEKIFMSRTRIYSRIIFVAIFPLPTWIFYTAHINLTFHALSLSRSNTVFSRHYIAKKCVTKHDALSSLSQMSRGRFAIARVRRFHSREWIARCKFSEQRGIKQRSFSRTERSQREGHASHLF